MNILIKSTNWVGDAVMQSPAIRALRLGYPDAHTALVARQWVAALFADHPDVDEVIIEPVDKSERRALGDSLRDRVWDLGVALPNSYSSASLLKRAGAKRRVGYARDGRRLLLTDPIKMEPWLLHVHETDYYLHIVEGLVETNHISRQPVVVTSEEAKAEMRRDVDEALGKLNLQWGEKPLLILGAAAAFGTAKRWLPERFAECARALRERHGFLPTLIGSEQEGETTRKIAELIGPPVLDLAGKMNIAGVAALLGEAALFVTNDSGPMHLAAAQDTPTVAVFGSTNWVTTAPLGAKSAIVREQTDCAPCLKRHCPIDHRCMENVPTERVLAAAESLIG